MAKVYLFYGEEDFLIDEEIKALKAKLVDPALETFNYEVVEEGEAGKIVRMISTAPMLGGQRLVVVKEFSLLTSSKQDESEIERLIACIQNMPSEVTLVFAVKGRVDKRKKLFKAIERVGVAKEFQPFAEWEKDKLLAWIIGRVKGRGKHMGSHAARLLTEISGSYLRQLDKEIEKLGTYLGERETIEEKDVATLSSPGQLEGFALLNALRDKDLQKALQALNRTLREKEEPAKILQGMATQYRMLLQVKSLREEGLGDYEIADRLGASPYFVKKCSEKTSRFSLSELIEDMELLHEADIKLKTGQQAPPLLLELLIIELCLPRKHAKV